jgi:hypothetical protein
MVEPQVPQNDRVAAYQPGPLSAQSSCIWSGEYDAIRKRETEIMEHTTLQEVIDPRVNECFGCPNDLISADVLDHESHS